MALLIHWPATAQTVTGLDSRVDSLTSRVAVLEQKLQESERLLQARSSQLEKALDRLDRLESGLAPANTGTAVAVAASPSAASPSMAQVTRDVEQPVAAIPGEHDHMSLSPDLATTRLAIRGFGDVSYTPSGLADPTTGPRSFTLGQMDLFITSRISDRLNVLVETVFEPGAQNDFGVDLERYLLRYRQSRYLKLEAGRNHSAIGFYNMEFHHGSWFQTAASRPFLFNFEDDGGLLPVHMIGLRASGEIPSGPLGLEYMAAVGNGRSYAPGAEPVQNFADTGTGRAYNFALSATPEALHGMQAGISFYHAILSPVATPIQQSIYAAHLVYRTGHVEFLNEAVWMRHTQEIGNRADILTTIPGGYTQFGYRFGPIRPYVRYEYLNPASADPIARLVLTSVGQRRELSGGIRYDIADFAALKFQLGRLSQTNGPSGIIGSFQVAFAF